MTKNRFNILLMILPVVTLTGIHLHSTFIDYHEMHKTIRVDKKAKSYREELASDILGDKYINVDSFNERFFKDNKEKAFSVLFTRHYSIIFKRIEKNKEVLMIQYPVLEIDGINGNKEIVWKCYGLPYIDMPRDDCRLGLSTLTANRLNFIWK